MIDNVRSMRTKVGDLDINYYQGGQGEPLIIIHGGASGSASWMKNLSKLTKDYTVYLPDLPGFGNSQVPVDDLYIPELVKFIDDFAHEIGINRFHLIGHSLGGGIALNYTLRFPHKVKKLVIISGMCLGREIAWWVRLLSRPCFSRLIGTMAISVFKGVKWVATRLFSEPKLAFPFCRGSISIGSSMTTIKEQKIVLVDRLSEIISPTLVVWGAKDPIIPARHAYATAQLIPSCQLRVFENCGHDVHSQKINEFSQLVLEFLG